MISSTGASDSLRSKLEEIFKLMLVVWAKEGLALKATSGKSNGKIAAKNLRDAIHQLTIASI